MHKTTLHASKNSITYSFFFILFLTTAQLYTMEKRETQKTGILPEDLLTQEIIPKIVSLNAYSNHQHTKEKDTHTLYNKDLLMLELIPALIKTLKIHSDPNYINNHGEDTRTFYNNAHGSNWHRYGYWENDRIFLKDTSIFVDAESEHLCLTNVFGPLKKLISHIRLAQKIALLNKDTNILLRGPISQTIICLASFILHKTDYEGTIFNMIEHKKSNTFLLQNVHYFIATAIGNYYGVKKNIPEHITRKIQLIICWTLKASNNTHANLLRFTQEREASMPANLPTNDRLNRFVLHLFAGMLQPLPDKKCTFTLESGRSQSGPGLDNTNYIQDTAEEMRIKLKIKYKALFYYDAFEPCIIEISERENSSLQNCVIQ